MPTLVFYQPGRNPVLLGPQGSRRTLTWREARVRTGRPHPRWRARRQPAQPRERFTAGEVEQAARRVLAVWHISAGTVEISPKVAARAILEALGQKK